MDFFLRSSLPRTSCRDKFHCRYSQLHWIQPRKFRYHECFSFRPSILSLCSIRFTDILALTFWPLPFWPGPKSRLHKEISTIGGPESRKLSLWYVLTCPSAIQLPLSCASNGRSLCHKRPSYFFFFNK